MALCVNSLRRRSWTLLEVKRTSGEALTALSRAREPARRRRTSIIHPKHATTLNAVSATGGAFFATPREGESNVGYHTRLNRPPRRKRRRSPATSGARHSQCDGDGVRGIRRRHERS